MKVEALVSVIVPLRNAQEYVIPYVARIHELLAASARSFEIVLIDDCSDDQTLARVAELQSRYDRIQLYCLHRHSGLNTALVAGLDNCIGDFAVTLDPRTDPPELVPRFLEFVGRGDELVYGVCQDPPGPGLERIARALRNWFEDFFRVVSGISLPRANTYARLYSRKIINYVMINTDRHRALRALPALASTTYSILPYSHVQAAGRWLRRSWAGSVGEAVGLLLSLSNLPLRIMSGLSILASFLSLSYAVYVLAIALIKRHVAEGWISLALPIAVMAFLLSLTLSIMSEYILSIAQESRKRPPYHIRKEAYSAAPGGPAQLNVVDSSGELARLDRS